VTMISVRYNTYLVRLLEGKPPVARFSLTCTHPFCRRFAANDNS
jgi:hypothetical protein